MAFDQGVCSFFIFFLKAGVKLVQAVGWRWFGRVRAGSGGRLLDSNFLKK